jgi:SAM-dependent methyltransferase
MTPLFQWVEQRCPICDELPTRYLGRRGGAAHHARQGIECRLWQCTRCSLIFPNPMPIPAGGAQALYDLDADSYFANHEVAYKDRVSPALVREAAARAGRKGRMLEIGSGRGEVLKAAAADGWDVLGLEPSPTFAAVARAHAPGVDLRETDLLHADLPSGSFDAVILQAVLEHLHNPAEVIAEVARVLAPGGVFYADVPNELGLYARAGNAYQRLRGRDWVVNLSPTFSPFHVFGYSVRSLRALYSRHGLEPLRFVVGGGHTSLARGETIVARLEHTAASLVTTIANAVGAGTYIASWARKPAR